MTRLLIATSPRSTWITCPDTETAERVKALLGDRAYEVRKKGQLDRLAYDIDIGVDALNAGEILLAAGYTFGWHEDQHETNRVGGAWGIPVEESPRDAESMHELVSVADAKKSIGYMIRMGAFWLDEDGLRIKRDPEASPDQVDVDHVLARLSALGVSDDSWKVEVRVGPNKQLRKKRHAYFVIHVDLTGTEHLASIFKEVRTALDTLAEAELRPD